MRYEVRPDSTRRVEFMSNTLPLARWTAQHKVASEFPCSVIAVWECTDDGACCHVVHRGAAGRGWHDMEPLWEQAA